MPATWSDALEALRRANPLSRLPHAQSVALFEQRVSSANLDFLSWRLPVERNGKAAELSLTVEAGHFSEPTVSEDAAREGRDDFVRWVGLDVVGRVGRRKVYSTTLGGSLPHLTSRGTLLRRSRGVPSEWAPLGQLLPAPGAHFVAPSRRDGASGDWVERQVHLWPEHGSPVRVYVAGQGEPHEIRVALAGGSWSLRTLAPTDGSLPLNRRPFLPQMAAPGFVLGPRARAALDRRLESRLGAELMRRLRAEHPDPPGLDDRRNLRPSDLVACGHELAREPDRAEDWRDDPGDLSHRRVLLLGDYFDIALRRGMALVWRWLGRQAPAQRLRALAEHGSGAFARGFHDGLHSLWRSRTEYFDDTNPLAALSAARKLTYCGPSGASPEQMHRELRDLHLSHHGRLCAIESPETDRVGLSLFLASHARVDAAGRIVTPLVEARGTVDQTAAEDLGRPVAAHRGFAAQQEEGGTASEITSALPERERAGFRLSRQLGRHAEGWSQDELKWQPVSEVAGNDAHPGQALGAGASLIPFIHHDDGARAMMGAKNMKQAVPLLAPQPPLVRTGFERLIGEASPLNRRATLAGKVTRLEPNELEIASKGRTERVSLRAGAGQHGTDQRYESAVKRGETTRPGQVVAWGPACKGGELALGRNLLVAYLPWEGWNFEDGIVASGRLLEEDVLTSTWCHTFVVPIFPDGRVGDELPELAPAGAVNKGGADVWVVPSGQCVKAGDDLVRAPRGTFRVPVGVDATVRHSRRVRLQRGSSRNPEYPELVVHVTVEQRRRLAVGDKLMGRHGNKGVVSRILDPRDMPRLRLGGQELAVDLLLNPLGVVSRMNVGQLLETHLGLVAWLRGASTPIRHPDSGPARVHFTVPPFTSIDEGWLGDQLRELGFPEGKAAGGNGPTLIDPATGKPFPAPVTVGVQYILKLNHYATDKLTTRTKGPSYSSGSRQAARGRRLRGGQRFGEMETWALQAYGTPHLLRELMGAKGDDVRERERGEPSLPEAFRMVTVFLRGLGIETELRLHDEAQWRSGIRYKMAVDPEQVEEVRLRWASGAEIKEWSRGRVRERGTAHQRVAPAPLYRCERCGEEVSRPQWVQGRHRQPCGGRLSKKSQPSLWWPRAGGLLCPEIFGGRAPEGQPLDVNPAALKPGAPLRRAWPEVARLADVSKGTEQVLWAPGAALRQIGERVLPEDEKMLREAGASWGTGSAAVAAVSRAVGAKTASEAQRRLSSRFATLQSVLLEDRHVVIAALPGNAEGLAPGRLVPDRELNEALESSDPEAPCWQGVRIGTGIGAVRSVLAARGHSEREVARLLGSAPVSAPADPKGYRDRFGHIALAEEVVHPWFLAIDGSPLRRGWPSLPGLASVLDGTHSVVVEPGDSNRIPGERVQEEDRANLECLGARIATGQEAVDQLTESVAAANPEQAWGLLRRSFAPLRSVLRRDVHVATATGASLRLAERWSASRATSRSGPARLDAHVGTGVRAVREVLQARGVDLEALAPAFLSQLPVIPAAFRDREARHFPPKKTLEGRYARALHWNWKLEAAIRDKESQERRDEIYRRLDDAVSALLGLTERSLGSLTAALSGKHGLMRKPLLGKRVDFSARAVIVPDPRLGLDEVSLPGELFEQVKASAGENQTRPLVLLNRSPSLHRYNIQAVHAVRRDDEVIGLHPLNCAGLAADFDGDTVAIHVPRAPEAVKEAVALLPSRNLLSVANGGLLPHLALDIVAGLYMASTGGAGSGVPAHLGSGTLTREAAVSRVQTLARHDPAQALAAAEEAMKVGFECATRAGLTLGLWDIWAPDPQVRQDARRLMESSRHLPDAQASRALDDGWAALMKGFDAFATGHHPNPLAVMYASGARDKKRQLGQLGSLRGLMEGCDGRPLPFFVESSLRRGLEPHEFFLCAHGTRKAMFEKKMVTGQAGGLTRWLAEGCNLVTVDRIDCVGDGRRLEGLSIRPPDLGWPWRALWGRTLQAGDGTIDDSALDALERADRPVVIRSPLFCNAWPAVCQRCYGLDLSTGQPAAIGLAVGILAAESIGERGTQLTMQTFHTGGGAGGTGLAIDRARRLFLTPPDTFEAFAKAAAGLYGKAVDPRHLEVAFARLARPADRTRVRGSIKAAALFDPRRHLLARASSYDSPAVLLAAGLWGVVAAGWETDDYPTWRVENAKERMLIGQLFHTVP